MSSNSALQSDRLHWAFALTALACALLFGYAVVVDAGRPAQVQQRLVPALGAVDRCELCHENPKHHAGLDDAHPPERFGCTVCHGGQGFATRKEAAHLVSMDWERPLFSPAEQAAACGRCHLGAQAPVPQVAKGRQLLADKGCAGCHAIPGVPRPDFAPELDGLRDAVSPGFVRAWLADPGKLQASHRMPTFRLNSEEIEALVAYLWSVPGPALAPLPADLTGDGERGKKAVATRRCATCHKIDGRGGDVGPDLALAGMKLQPAWIFTLLVDTHRLRPHTRMPGFRLAPQEALDIATYAGEEWLADSGEPPWKAYEAPVEPTKAVQGKKLFADLGCAGCHRVAGQLGAQIAPALDRLGDRHVVDLPHTATGEALPDLPSWVARKVQLPTAFDQKGGAPARMPTLPGLTAADALAVGTALASLRAVPLPATLLRDHDPPELRLPAGQTGRLIDRFRCLVCHSIGGHGGDVARIALDGAGARLNRAWLEDFLQSPVTVRMDQAERMPILGMTAAEAQQLAAWLQGALGDDRVPLAEPATASAEAMSHGANLYAQLGCPTCHMAAGAGTMKGPTLDGSARRLQPGYVQTLLSQPALVPANRHAGIQLSAEQAAAVAAYVLGLPAPQAP